MSDDDKRNMTLAVEKEAVESCWAKLCSYSNQSGLSIEWDESRGLLDVSGFREEELGTVQDEILEIIYESESPVMGEFTWNGHLWYRENQSVDFILAVAADEEISRSQLQHFWQIAARHVQDTMPDWQELVAEHIYNAYASEMQLPRSTNEFVQALTVEGEIVYTPEEKSYELYFRARPYFEGKLIWVFQQDETTFPPKLIRG